MVVAGRRRLQQRVPPLVREVATKAANDRITGLAAEVAFWSLLSLVPTMLVLASLLGSIGRFVGGDVATRVEDGVVAAMSEVFTDDAGGLIEAVRQLFNQPQPGLFSVALVLVAWTASRAFNALAAGLDLIFSNTNRRRWVVRRLLGLGLALASLTMGTLVAVVLVVSPIEGRGVLGEVVVLVVLIGWAAAMYHFAPARSTRWRNEVPGAVLAGALWVAFSLGFRVYLNVQGGNEVVTGLGGVLIALLWLYLMALALFLGGVVNAVVAQRRHRVSGRTAGGGGGGGPGEPAPPGVPSMEP
jgi:membrane protein